MKPRSTSSRPKLLYVEDEVIVAIDVSDALDEEFGFDVHMAHNLRLARKAAEEGEFDYALLDINLGHGERSIELGRELVEQGVPVVFATGYNREEFAELSGYTLIEKPFKPRDLAAAFESATRQSQELATRYTQSAAE